MAAMAACAAFILAATPSTTRAQVNLTPDPNLTISWDLNQDGFAAAVGGGGTPVPDTTAGLVLATNWNDGWEENYSDVSSSGVTVTGLFDITGAATAASLTYAGYNGYAANDYSQRPPQDANGTFNMQMLNGYLNAGPAAWSPPITNSYVTISNIPYPDYDVVVYFSTDTSGRKLAVSDGTVSDYCSTIGGAAEVGGANALFLPAANTNSTLFPQADFAFFPGQTNSSVTLTTYPLSGNDQWLGIAGFQIVQAFNTYVLYGPSPASQVVPLGQPASFSVMAGGSSPQYQWQLNGETVPGATNATYSIASTTSGQGGNYSVIVSNSFSSVTSSVATLTFYTPKTDIWTDASGNSIWDTTSTNWNVNGVAGPFTQTDNAMFNGTGEGSPNVTLAGALEPNSITVATPTPNPYLLTSGGIAAGTLHVTTNATLILDTLDSSSGWTLIDAGSTLQIDNNDTAGSLGSGLLTNNGSILFDSSGSYAYGGVIYGSGNVTNIGGSSTSDQITLGGSVNAGYLVQDSPGQLLLQGSNNLTGGLVVDAGAVVARVGTSIGSSTVVLNGGILQLFFANDFTGTALTLAGGLLEGGQGGNNSYDGTVTLTTESDIEVGGGDTFTLNSATGIVNSANETLDINQNGGTGTLILPGTGNTWTNVTIWGGSLQIGNGGPGGSLGSGTISDQGNLLFDLAGNLVVTNPISGGGGISQNGSGTVILTADNNAAGFSGNIDVTSGTLLVNGTAGDGEVTVTNTADLGGSGTVEGAVVTYPGTTLSAGSSSLVGTLTIGGGLTLGGNVLVKVNTSLVKSNDLVAVTGSLVNNGSGSMTVNNLGPTLTAGDKFTLFSQPVSGGSTLAVTGGGVVWSNNLANDGSIIVLSAAVPRPVIQNISISGGNIVVSGANGSEGGTFYLLSSTNLTAPLAAWVRVSTNTFDGNGNFNITNAVGGAPQSFYILESQ
jgi:autotransporter-associated beta strand protein